MRWLIAGAIMAVTVTGCGGGSSQPQSAPTGSTSPAATVAAAPTSTPTLTPDPTPSIHANAGQSLDFFVGCERVKLVIAELTSAHPRLSFARKVLNEAGQSLTSTHLTALHPYLEAVRASVGIPAVLNALARLKAVCRASGQTTGSS